MPVVVALLVFLGPPVFRQLVRWVTAKPSPEEMAPRAERAVIDDNTANDWAVTLRRKVISEMRDSGVRLTGFGEDIVEFLYQERVTPEGAWQSAVPATAAASITIADMASLPSA